MCCVSAQGVQQVFRGRRADPFTKVAPFGLLWILTNYLYLQALRKINTTDASALFCCNKAFVFLLSWIVLRDRFMGVRGLNSRSVSADTHRSALQFGHDRS
ncbi:unnamed protein product [Pleuronectes platessa]|uniref:Uncharacterized protein n=1 Tax=Pleuronectes platessa TaxID=8262 RepID=A0A9N7VQQ0_PLEPL|nr:unnamed protein product [Pleuronectes platessa]